MKGLFLSSGNRWKASFSTCRITFSIYEHTNIHTHAHSFQLFSHGETQWKILIDAVSLDFTSNTHFIVPKRRNKVKEFAEFFRFCCRVDTLMFIRWRWNDQKHLTHNYIGLRKCIQKHERLNDERTPKMEVKPIQINIQEILWIQCTFSLMHTRCRSSCKYLDIVKHRRRGRPFSCIQFVVFVQYD